ncbi:hypothetical protein H072_165 [Dactylellina haptotyla CBS 200.50]|uniref:Zn(2)-C6 fungal-type domain-containing protein n=1 Tax=Dactylellina haptotyla (strain CBS 200.50) TaxID=1284197 RepID=S8C2I6_DACHA|nr:hypothetical protein H072_165 [Dactylellina haptotyla CBS 200.50]
MSPRTAKPHGLRLSICSTTCSSNGDYSAGSVTPSSATTFSISPTSSLNVNLPFSTYSASCYAASSGGSVKEEPCTPGFLTSSDENDDTGDTADTEASPPHNEVKPELGLEAKLELKTEDTTPTSLIPPQPIKRPRGRPRKNPPNPPEPKTKVTKGRSKTGCLTCRKRKKKCDEGKPECNNCGKNGYVCEGYSPKTYWRSGRDSNHRLSAFQPTLPALIEGVESDLDRKLLNHFVVTVSSVLSQFGDEKNPFKELLLPLAIDNSGLMHSMLCLAASHLAKTDPSVRNAQYHHKDLAIKILKQGINSLTLQEGSVIDDSTVATTIVLCLEAICEGDNTGMHSHHMHALNIVANKMNERAIARDIEPHEMKFAQFFIEFFRYHIILDGVTNMARRPTLDLGALGHGPSPAPFMPVANTQLISQPDLEEINEAGTLIGTLNVLFTNILNITTLRDLIRKRKAESIYPTIDEMMLSKAVEIDEQVRSWRPTQSPTQPWRYFYGMLYQQRSVPDPKIRNAVDEGLKCLAALPPGVYSHSVLLMPVFLLGCAAFDVEQQPEIAKKLDEMKAAGLHNAIHAQKVVEKIWQLMTEEDETSWDWEKIIQDFGYDFLLS